MIGGHVMRKMALSELECKELELFADGCKGVDICKTLGITSNPGRVCRSFFTIVNFGYDGVIPDGVEPKFAAEDLCRRVCLRMGYNLYDFRNNSPVSLDEFCQEGFMCGVGRFGRPVGMQDDIRCLDLSRRAFCTLLGGWNMLHGHERLALTLGTPFTIENLVQISEDKLLRLRGLSQRMVDEIKQELGQHGLALLYDEPSLNPTLVRGDEVVYRNNALTDESAYHNYALMLKVAKVRFEAFAGRLDVIGIFNDYQALTQLGFDDKITRRALNGKYGCTAKEARMIVADARFLEDNGLELEQVLAARDLDDGLDGLIERAVADSAQTGRSAERSKDELQITSY